MEEKQTTKDVQSFTDLLTWQESHKFVVSIYKITKKYPDDERFGLVSQMRRAAVSITSNIAEGFGRHSFKEKLHFYYYSSGSLTELKNQLTISRDIQYINTDEMTNLSEMANNAHRLLNGLIRKTKTQIE